jgi:hypothetical protein
MITENELKKAIWDNDAIVIPYTGTAGLSAQLAPGIYYLTADTNVFFKQGDSSVVAVAGVSNRLPIGTGVVVWVPAVGDNDYISVVRQTDSGSAYMNFPSAG